MKAIRIVLAGVALLPFACKVNADVIDGDLPPAPVTAPPVPTVKPTATCTATAEPACPSTRPTDSTSSGCSGAVRPVCEYGTNVDPSCNDVVACDTGTAGTVWTTRHRGTCADPVCPAKLADVPIGAPCSAGDAGSSDETLCPYAGVLCGCTTGPDGAHPHEQKWVCVNMDGACPVKRPLRGQSCPSTVSFEDALTCDYGSGVFRGGVLMTCRRPNPGVWLTGTPSCP